jgi:site-specific recombinase XerC
LQDYHQERRAVKLASPATSRQKNKSQPLFTRHDRAAGEGELRRLDSSSAWDIVKNRAREAVGAEAAAQIHPHSFRHYFVTVVLLATDNLEKARRLARHKSITVTQRYAEIDPELDKDYYDIFDAKKPPRIS